MVKPIRTYRYSHSDTDVPIRTYQYDDTWEESAVNSTRTESICCRSTLKFKLTAAVFIVIGLASPARSGTQPVLVKDIHTEGVGNDSPALLAVGGQLYYQAEDPVHGNELWVTDGTSGSERLVKDLRPGCEGSNPRYFAAVGDRLFFLAGGVGSTLDLWTSDGTDEGTWLLEASVATVTSQDPGPPPEIVAADDRVFFTADKNETGREIWTSDGSVEGTFLPRDIRPGPRGPGNQAIPRYLTTAGSRAIFRYANPDGSLWGSDGSSEGTRLISDLLLHEGTLTIPLGDEWIITASNDSTGVALWAIDDTHADPRLVADIPPGPDDFAAYAWAELDGAVLMAAPSGIWTTDGTEDGTRIVVSDPHVRTRDPSEFVVVGDTLFFSGDDRDKGTELWRTDGTQQGTFLVKDIYPGWRNSDPSNMIAFGEVLFFTADDGEHGVELWVTDGTTDGTRLVRDILPGPESSDPTLLTRLGDRLFFYADGPDDGRELWMSDGTAEGTIQAHDTVNRNGSAFSLTSGITAVGSTIYFAARQADHGVELWTSDGTADGTEMLLDILPGDEGSFPTEFHTIDNRFIFWALVDGEGVEPWGSDGTSEGTRQLGDLAPGDSIPTSSVIVDGRLVFSIEEPGSPAALWMSDATIEGTVSLGEISSDPEYWSYRKLGEASGRAVVSAYDTKSGEELRAIDLETGESTLLADAVPGPQGSFPILLGTVGETLLFLSQNEYRESEELWSTDGTESGTRFVVEVDDIDEVYETVEVEQRVFLLVENEDEFCQLWTSDGSPEGTRVVLDTLISDCGDDEDPRMSLAAVGDRLFFVYDDAEHGKELWTSDGTSAGTRLVADIHPGEAGSNPFALVESGGRLVFMADDGARGVELWMSDGTSEGTQLVGEIQPGDCGLPSAGDPFIHSSVAEKANMVDADGMVFFAADDGVRGSELWAYRPPIVAGLTQLVVRGDCDGDGLVGGTVTDPVFYLNWVFGVGQPPGCRAACDANGDGFVGGSVTDAVYYLNWAFAGGREPPPPFPGCGQATEEDRQIGCEKPPLYCSGAE